MLRKQRVGFSYINIYFILYTLLGNNIVSSYFKIILRQFALFCTERNNSPYHLNIWHANLIEITGVSDIRGVP